MFGKRKTKKLGLCVFHDYLLTLHRFGIGIAWYVSGKKNLNIRFIDVSLHVKSI